MSSNSVSLLVSVAALAGYGYAAYYMNYSPAMKKIQDIQPASLTQFGLIRFLTYQCLLVQFSSIILHIVAHFVRALRPARDLVFTALAYPLGSIVVYSFWSVWHLMGRELIFPVALDPYYPPWLNHTTHTLIVPLNLLLIVLIRHRYSARGLWLTLSHIIGYTIFLHYVKFQTGFFVYPYLDKLDEVSRAVYFLATGVAMVVLYKSGQLLNKLFHGSDEDQKGAKKSKQR